MTAVSRVRNPLPIGVSDYREVWTGYYYLDKTMLIKDFQDERPQVSVFTHPRRFGKTLNMEMLRAFLRRPTRIPPSISGTRISGPAAAKTANIRAVILSSM